VYQEEKKNGKKTWKESEKSLIFRNHDGGVGRGSLTSDGGRRRGVVSSEEKDGKERDPIKPRTF